MTDRASKESPLMMSFLAVLLGLAAGVGLALPLAIHLRRRVREQRDAQGPPVRPSMLGTPAQRRRALWIAAGIAALAVAALAAGAPAFGSPLLLLALLLTGQTVLFGLIAQVRARAK
jgi:hypothetical protein